MAGKLYSNRELGKQIGLLSTRQDDFGLGHPAQLPQHLSPNPPVIKHQKKPPTPNPQRPAPNPQTPTPHTNPSHPRGSLPPRHWPSPARRSSSTPRLASGSPCPA